MADWCVFLGAEGDPGDFDSDRAAGSLMDLVAEHGGAVAANDRGWDVTLTQVAPDPLSALVAAAGMVPVLAERAGFPAWPLVRLEAGPYDPVE